MRRKIYTNTVKLLGKTHSNVTVAASNLANTLILMGEDLDPKSIASVREGQKILAEALPLSLRVNGADHEITHALQTQYAMSFCLLNELKALDDDESRDDIEKGLATMEDVYRRSRQILGEAHPQTTRSQYVLTILQQKVEMIRSGEHREYFNLPVL